MALHHTSPHAYLQTACNDNVRRRYVIYEILLDAYHFHFGHFGAVVKLEEIEIRDVKRDHHVEFEIVLRIVLRRNFLSSG